MEDLDGFITILSKRYKKQKVINYFCTLCKCVFGDVEMHQDGNKHSRLLEVVDILPILQQHGIDMCINCSLCYLLNKECKFVVFRLVE
jgi:hypothetical protein